MRVGGHVSIAGGIAKAPERAAVIGAECVQTFASSPRGWQLSVISDEEVKLYKDEAEKYSVYPLFFHAIYLTNLAAGKSEHRKKSIESVSAYLKTAHRIGAEGVIAHIGSHGGDGLGVGIERVISSVKEILAISPGGTRLCLENTAGGGDTIGRNVEELGAIIKEVDSSRLFVCLDTAHAFESGYDLRDEKGVKSFAKEFRKHVGEDRLLAMHVNDSKTELASHVDRHENIGEGYLGMDAFTALMEHKLFSSVPWFLEVPGLDGKGPDKKNIDLLKKIRG